MGRRGINPRTVTFDRRQLLPEEVARLEACLATARRHILEYPVEHVLSRAAVRLLASWGEPAPRKASSRQGC